MFHKSYEEELIPVIVIDESAKEDFKQLMGWDEAYFKLLTTQVTKGFIDEYIEKIKSK